jgi:hypothetical protein
VCYPDYVEPSQHCMDLMRSLLQPDPAKRATSAEVGGPAGSHDGLATVVQMRRPPLGGGALLLEPATQLASQPASLSSAAFRAEAVWVGMPPGFIPAGEEKALPPVVVWGFLAAQHGARLQGWSAG